MQLAHGNAHGVPGGSRLTGCWRYDRTARRGIALRYDRRAGGPPAAVSPNVHAGGRFVGRWRYRRVVGRGMAVSYERVGNEPPAPTRPRAAPMTPVPTHSPFVRVLCSCGHMFTFDGEADTCPGCGRLAEWPTIGVIEREMRSDLENLLRAHGHTADPD